ncbi:ATP-binding protein [Alloscardovia macacae]|nr:ATP-binding protein [Alloscardovia macacae]
MAALYIASSMSWLKSLVVVACGYSAQHVASNAYTALLRALGEHISVDVTRTDAYYVAVYACIYGMLWTLFAHTFRFDEEKVRRRPFWVMGCIVLLILLVVVNIFVIQKHTADVQIALYLYDAVASIFALAALTQASTNTRLSYDLEVMEKLDRMQERHYTFAKENIDLINEVGHDLRRSLRDAGLARQASEAVSKYDATFHTGSAELDVLLTERALYCASRNITLTALADGHQLKNLQAADIYSIFGNLLDNAIEHVEKYATAQHPGTVDVTVRKRAEFVQIEVINPLHAPVHMRAGVPISTKTRYVHLHGFGTKSVQRHVHELGGEMTISTEMRMYTVTILLPLS